MALYGEDKSNKKLDKSSEELETSVIINSSKLNEVITNQISGYKWKVDYYNQILNIKDIPKQLDTSINGTLQPYRLIEDAELILSSPITSTSTANLNGDAIVDIRVAVNKYDLFIAEVHNKVAIFYVEEVIPETYEDNTIYKIVFKFFGFTSDKLTYDNLISKIVTRYIFNPNYRFSNQKPILLKNDVLDYNRGILFAQTIMIHYYQKYFDSKIKLVVDKKDCNKMLDVFLNKFIKAVIPTNIIEWVSRLEYVDIDNYTNINIFDALVKKTDITILDKLYTSVPENKYTSIFYREVIKVEVMSNNVGCSKDFYSDKYFIKDNFYTNTLEDFEDTETFEMIMFKYINGMDILIPEIVNSITINKNDEYSYFKIPILIYIYLRTLERYKL